MESLISRAGMGPWRGGTVTSYPMTPQGLVNNRCNAPLSMVSLPREEILGKVAGGEDLIRSRLGDFGGDTKTLEELL